jgi:hypothetical protein
VVVSLYLAIHFFTIFCSSFRTIIPYIFGDCYISQQFCSFHKISSYITVGSYFRLVQSLYILCYITCFVKNIITVYFERSFTCSLLRLLIRAPSNPTQDQLRRAQVYWKLHFRIPSAGWSSLYSSFYSDGKERLNRGANHVTGIFNMPWNLTIWGRHQDFPSEGTRVVDFYRPRKSIVIGLVWTSEPWVQWQAQ